MSFYANHPQIIYDSNLEIENARGIELNLDARLDKINSSLDCKIQSVIFTSIGDTSVITHGLDYNNLTDKLSIIDLCYGSVLTLGEHYNETNTNVTLIGWNLLDSQKLEITVTKNCK